jgi:hypothetical protein
MNILRFPLVNLKLTELENILKIKKNTIGLNLLRKSIVYFSKNIILAKADFLSVFVPRPEGRGNFWDLAILK